MINNITLMGRLVAAPELKKTNSGIDMVTFTVAVERDFKGQDGNRQTDFIPCLAWRKSAEFIAHYFPKGAMIAVTGSLQTNKYTDKDGNPRTAYQVVIDKASFTGEKISAANGSNSGGQAYAPTQESQAYGYQAAKTNNEQQWAELSGDDGALPF